MPLEKLDLDHYFPLPFRDILLAMDLHLLAKLGLRDPYPFVFSNTKLLSDRCTDTTGIWAIASVAKA